MSDLDCPLDELPHYDRALEEVCRAIPREVPAQSLIKIEDVRNLMILCWLRGYEAGKGIE